MQKILIGVLISLCFSTLKVLGQKDAEWLKKFKKAPNDSIFISTHSDEPYRIFKMQPWMLALDENNQRLFDASVGTIINFSSSEETHLSKVIKVEEKKDTVMQVSHIFFKHDSTAKINKKDLERQAEKVYQKILKGADFIEMAKKYSQDGSANLGGSLGKFKANVMVKPFEDAVLKHKKGDVFKVWTRYGLHIVKVDAAHQFKTKKAIVEYVRFVKGKKYLSGKTPGYQMRLPAGWEQKASENTTTDISLSRLDIPVSVNIQLNQPTVNISQPELESGYKTLKATHPELKVKRYEQRKISNYKGFYFESFYTHPNGNKLRVYTFIFNSKKYSYVVTLVGLQQNQTYLQRMFYSTIEDMKINN